MKKILSIVFALFATIAVAACNAVPTADTFGAPEDVVGFEAISATELLAGTLDPVATVAQPLTYAILEETTTEEPADDEETVVDDDLSEIDKYLAMIERFLGNTNGLSVTVESSDLPEYTYKMTYVSKDILGNDVTYVLYYTEVLYEEPVDGDPVETTTEEPAVTTEEPEATTEEPETTTESATTTEPLSFEDRDQDQERLRNREFEFQDENDDDVVYALTGMLLVGESTFYLEGKKVVEDDEEVMMLRSFVDHDNFVKVRYQSDGDGDRKFFYEIVADGVIVNRSKIKVDVEDDGVKVDLSFIEGEACGRYQFKLETVENVTTIMVQYDVENEEGAEESGKIRIVATYDEASGLTTYTYDVIPEYRNGHRVDHQESHEFETQRGGRGGQDNGHGGRGAA
ncbi:MAG: hypothetical protein WC509_00510 [Candidatus Izemoplasmatales bacterium]